jgi:LacI family transcriptional regulator
MSDLAIRTVAKQRPIMVLNRVVTGVPSVVIDNRGGIRSAVDHLVQLGHDRITYIAGPEASWSDGIRWRALHEFAAELGVRVHRRGPFAPTIDGGMHAADLLREHPAPAVIAYNDQIAIGLMRRLSVLGVRIPGQLSVVGFDNIFAAELVTPGLTTVGAPLRAQGVAAVTNLLAILGGARPRSRQPIVLPTRLVVRGSSAKAAGPGRPE